MIKISRPILTGAFLVIFLSSACSLQTGASTPIGTILPENQTQVALPLTQTISVTATGISITPLIPITGENVVSMQCQFCVQNETHAVLIFPEFAYFDVVSTSPVHCLTADVVNGQRILICRGVQETSFKLNICSDGTNCLQFPIALQPCALLEANTLSLTATPSAPRFLTPVNPINAPTQPARTAVAPPTLTPESVTLAPTLPVPTSAVTLPPPLQPTNTAPPPPIEPTVGGDEEGGDVVICHVPPGNPDERKTMTVSQSAWQNEHSRHGDSLGPCP